MSTIKPTNLINVRGKSFKLFSTHSTRQEAKKQAKQIRDAGDDAVVRKADPPYFGGAFGVFKRGSAFRPPISEL